MTLTTVDTPQKYPFQTYVRFSVLDVYVILLVRSEILEIKESQKNGGISTLVMSSGMPDAQEPHDIEAQVDCKDKPSSEGRREQKSDNKK